MKKILITGASGFVGRSLAARFLLEPSLDVVLAIRKSVEATSDRATVVSVGDINGDTQWAHALQGLISWCMLQLVLMSLAKAVRTPASSLEKRMLTVLWHWLAKPQRPELSDLYSSVRLG